MEKFSSHMIADARFDYERRSLETLETALSRTPIYQSWKSLDPGPGHAVDLRYQFPPRSYQRRHTGPFPLRCCAHGAGPRCCPCPRGGELRAHQRYGRRGAGKHLESTVVGRLGAGVMEAELSRRACGHGAAPEAILASALSVGPRSEEDRSPENAGCSAGSSFSTNSGRRRNGPRGTRDGFLRNWRITSPRSSRPTRRFWRAWPGLPGGRA